MPSTFKTTSKLSHVCWHRGDRQLRASTLAVEAASLNALARWEEAEVAAREAVAIRQELMPEEWSYFNAIGHLGESLMGQSKMAEAERLLLDGHAGLQKRKAELPIGDREKILKVATQRLITLYTAINRPDETAKWETELKRLQEQFSDDPAEIAK